MRLTPHYPAEKGKGGTDFPGCFSTQNVRLHNRDAGGVVSGGPVTHSDPWPFRVGCSGGYGGLS